MADMLDSLTDSWLKESFLLGIDLTLDDGSPYPDTLYTQSISSAISYVEHELGIVLNEISVDNERHDALDINRAAWWPLRLDRRPVLEVTKFELRFGNYQPVNIPVSWCQILSPEHGQVHLIPSQESLGSYLYRAGVPLIMGDTLTPHAYIPGYFQIGYKAGFEMRGGTVTMPSGEQQVSVTLSDEMPNANYFLDYATGNNSLGRITIDNKSKSSFDIKTQNTAGGGNGEIKWGITTVPADLKHIVGLKAAMLGLDVAGDLIAGAGVANYSIGADGVHQSLGTTSSATNSGYGARRLAFERELKALLPALRAKYKTMNFGCV